MSIPKRFKKTYKSIQQSKYIDYAFEFCNTYAWPMVIFNLLLYGLLLTPTFAVLFVGAILLHEGGHYIVQRYYGTNPDLYVFPLLGAGVSEPYRDKESNVSLSNKAKRDIFLAGPTVSLVLSASAVLAYTYFGHYEFLAFAIVFSLNEIFNLLPFWKVDGGRTHTISKKFRENQPHQVIITRTAHAGLMLGNIALLLYLLVAESVSINIFLEGILG